jgi:hypothetical protein
MLDVSAAAGRPGGATRGFALQSTAPPSASLFSAPHHSRRPASPATAFLGFGRSTRQPSAGAVKAPVAPSSSGASWWRAARASSVGAGLWVSLN